MPCSVHVYAHADQDLTNRTVTVLDLSAASSPTAAMPDTLTSGRNAEQTTLIARAWTLVSATAPATAQRALAVAQRLTTLRVDHETLAAALLHSAIPDIDTTTLDTQVAALINALARLDRLTATLNLTGANPAAHIEALRQMLLALAQDLRAVLILLAERLEQLSTLQTLPMDEALRLARATLELYAPLANRLGIRDFKWQFEDLAFRHLQPDTYHSLAQRLDERRTDREEYLTRVTRALDAALTQAGIRAHLSARPKHLYSIYRKMQKKQLEFNAVFDTRAVRVLVDDIPACYAALGVVHGLWPYLAGEFDDYITRPKNNLYQSLHTAVIGPDGKVVEVQIRTHAMHQHAEYGVAAHWRYKEGGHTDTALTDRIAWVRRLMEWNETDAMGEDVLARFTGEVFADRVYVFTPKGAIIDLPHGATPLDFAYHIHSEVGHRCRGAKVNGVMVPLTYTLHNGEQAEILTAKQGTPSRDWLNPHLGYLKSSHARARVRAWFREQDREHHIAAGRVMLERELRRLGAETASHTRLAERLHYPALEEFLAALGRGDVHSNALAQALQEPSTTPTYRALPTATTFDTGGEVTVRGVSQLLTEIAPCCKPVVGEAIIGYITRGRGVAVHRRDCTNVLHLSDEQRARLIEVEWALESARRYPVALQIDAYQRAGLLHDITTVLNHEQTPVLSLNSALDEDRIEVRVRLALEVANMDELARVLAKLNAVPNVIEARRV